MSSPWAPFRHRRYAILWTATLLANIGVWMYSAAAGWLMTSLDPDPLMVSLVQAAATLPMFLFALPAGALADIVDTRRYLVATEAGVILCAIPLAWLVGQDAMTPVLLLLFTFLIESAAALAAPAWQSIVPQLVPREDLGAAIAANSMEVNLSRAIGPALGGILGAAFGAAAPFWVNAFSNVGSIAALLGMRHTAARAHGLPAERLAGAMRAGMRHARGNPPLRSTLKRAALFFFLASAYWGLLPLVVRDRLGGGGDLYGWLLGTIGVGAVGAVFMLPALERAVGHERLVSGAQVGTGLSMALFAFAAHPAPALAASLVAGACWIAGVSRLNVSAQLSLPDWVRARGLALHVALTFGAMTLGSVAWGQLARVTGLVPALYAAAAAALVLVPLAARWKLGSGSGLDHSPSMHWPAPVVSEGVEEDQGPVMVAVEYRVAQSNRAAFLAASDALERQRERSGAYGWGMFEDTARAGRFVETFYAESWLEHLRQHERVTVADRAADERVRALVESEPVVTHLVAARRDSRGLGPGAILGEAVESGPEMNVERIKLPTERRPNVQGQGPKVTPTDAQMRAKALSRWEGEGGALGRAASPGDALDDSELRILARIGAAALGEWAALPDSLREAMLGTVCRPLVPGDGARAKQRIAKFLEENANR